MIINKPLENRKQLLPGNLPITILIDLAHKPLHVLIGDVPRVARVPESVRDDDLDLVEVESIAAVRVVLVEDLVYGVVELLVGRFYHGWV
jgi:hypothetical protein